MKQVVFILVLLTVVGCQSEDSWQMAKLPAHFPKPVQDMGSNPITKAGFELGRSLFYDPILSRDGTISCGSCHEQGSGFTHHGHDVSHGIDDQLGKRNALPIQNLLWQSSYFWDGGVSHIDLISINPIENPVEMDETLPNIIEKLNKHPQYPKRFQDAFGSSEITGARFLRALSQFMASLISANSKYDQYKLGKTTLTGEEQKGELLFQQKCQSCHNGLLFSDNSFRNNGLKPNYDFDKGRYEISLRPEDTGKFKVPSLRNVARTAPYMHSGALNTLEDVLQHYDSGIHQTPTLDPLLKQGISMSLKEQQQIIAFLHTLTDETFLRNPAFGQP